MSNEAKQITPSNKPMKGAPSKTPSNTPVKGAPLSKPQAKSAPSNTPMKDTASKTPKKNTPSKISKKGLVNIPVVGSPEQTAFYRPNPHIHQSASDDSEDSIMAGGLALRYEPMLVFREVRTSRRGPNDNRSLMSEKHKEEMTEMMGKLMISTKEEADARNKENHSVEDTILEGGEKKEKDGTQDEAEKKDEVENKGEAEKKVWDGTQVETEKKDWDESQVEAEKKDWDGTQDKANKQDEMENDNAEDDENEPDPVNGEAIIETKQSTISWLDTFPSEDDEDDATDACDEVYICSSSSSEDHFSGDEYVKEDHRSLTPADPSLGRFLTKERMGELSDVKQVFRCSRLVD